MEHTHTPLTRIELTKLHKLKNLFKTYTQQLDLGVQKTHQKIAIVNYTIFLMVQFLEHHPLQCSVCDPAKIFFTSKFSYLLFGNPSAKTETAGTATSKPPGTTFCDGPIRNTGQQSDHIYYTLFSLFLHVQQRCSAFYQPP